MMHKWTNVFGLLLMLVLFISCEQSGKKAEGESPVQSTEITYSVSGMTCDHCAKFITESAEKINGVKSCQVSLEDSTAQITFSSGDISEEKLLQEISKTGYGFKKLSPQASNSDS